MLEIKAALLVGTFTQAEFEGKHRAISDPKINLHFFKSLFNEKECFGQQVKKSFSRLS